jgi:polyisoprenoid-binding protein YceI
MKNSFRNILLLPLLTLAGSAYADLADMPAGEYGLDKDHGYITFSYSHFGYSTPHIAFESFDLNLTLDPKNPENSSVTVTIDATSVSSRVDRFDGHLNGANFFDTAKHPEITFQSTSMSKTGDSTYDVVGDLTIKGITKSVTLNATINKAANHPRRNTPIVGMSGEAKVNRSDWGLARGLPNVGDEVTIRVTAEMPKAAAN